MRDYETDILILGAGAAGLGAARAAAEEGAQVILAERTEVAGGILNQCIHNGFGLQYFKKELTGPEFSDALARGLEDPAITFLPRRFLLNFERRRQRFTFVSETGVEHITCKALVYAAGARERPFGSLLIPGDRVSGIFTAGVAQRLINLENCLPGRRALILGSGDIGLIMARRLTLEGVEVAAVVERQPHIGGLERNRISCLEDFGIPLQLSTTVLEVRGRGRLEEVITAKVDEGFRPIRGTERAIGVDTLILSVGLVPSTTAVMALMDIDPGTRGVLTDNLQATSRDWVFAAGNCVAIFDSADAVTREGERAGRNAVAFLRGRASSQASLPIAAGAGVGSRTPARYVPGTPLELHVRTARALGTGALSLSDGRRRIKTGKTKPMTPGEMESLRVGADQLEGVTELRIEVLSDE